MDKNELRSQLLALLEPLCVARALDVWGVEILFGAGGRHRLVRIYLDSPAGVDVEDCAEISRRLSLVLDVEDIIPGAYTLEISSPGLERLFFSPDQLQPYLGRTIRARLQDTHDGRKNFKGSLIALNSPQFTLSVDGVHHTLNWEDVAKAHLVHELDVPGKPGKRSPKDQR